MGRIWLPGGGGGADLDVVTAVAGDILKGKVIVGPDGEPLTGTLELTGTAADSQVLSGKTYYNTDAKTKRTGTMANKGAVTATLNCGGSYTIPAGYHNGSGKVTGNSLASQTDANAAAGDIEAGKTAYVKGSKITGTLALSGNAADGEVLSGKTYYNNALKTKRTGTMANQGAKTAALNCGGSYTIPAGFHNGSGKVTANSLASQTDANAAAGDIRKDKTAYVKGSKIAGTLGEMAGGTHFAYLRNDHTISCANKIMTSDIVIQGKGPNNPCIVSKVGSTCHLIDLAANSSGTKSELVEPIYGTGQSSTNAAYRRILSCIDGRYLTELFAFISVYGTIGSGINFVGSSFTTSTISSANKTYSNNAAIVTCHGFGKDGSGNIVAAKFEVIIGRMESNSGVGATGIRNLTWVNNTSATRRITITGGCIAALLNYRTGTDPTP